VTGPNNERECANRRRGCHRMVAWTVAIVMLGALVGGTGSVVMAQDASAVSGGAVAGLKVDTGDTGWVLISHALVCAMQVRGLAWF